MHNLALFNMSPITLLIFTLSWMMSSSISLGDSPPDNIQVDWRECTIQELLEAYGRGNPGGHSTSWYKETTPESIRSPNISAPLNHVPSLDPDSHKHNTESTRKSYNDTVINAIHVHSCINWQSHKPQILLSKPKLISVYHKLFLSSSIPLAQNDLHLKNLKANSCVT